MKKLLLVLVLFASPAWATTYYVNKSGSDANSCATAQSATDANAKLTIAAGLACLSAGAGDTLNIGDGTYAEFVDNAIPSGMNSTTRTIVQAENRQLVLVNGCTGNSYVIEVENKNYITIDGLVIDAAACTLAGITIGDDAGGLGGAGSTYVTLQNSEIKNADVWICVSFHQTGSSVLTSNITIHNNIVHNCGTTSPTTDTFDGHGIYPSIKNSTISNNIVYDVGNNVVAGGSAGGEAIHQYHNGDTGMDNNVYKNNTCYNNYGGCIGIRGGTNDLVYNNICYNNALYDEGAGCITISGGGNGAVVNAQVYNNTIYDNNGAGIYMANCTSVTIRNNIYYSNGSPTTGSCTTTTSSNNTSSDPGFISAATGNFRLAACTAVACDQGTTVASVTTDADGISRPQGAAYDIGAFEFQTTPTGASVNIFVPSRVR